MKYNLNDEDLQIISDKIRHLMEVKYKDEIVGIEPHLVDALCQNYVIQCKNNNTDFEKLLEEENISID